jgi:hypothetical protein
LQPGKLVERLICKGSLNRKAVFPVTVLLNKDSMRRAGNLLLSNEARVASRLRDMTERVTTSKGKYNGALPRKRAIGAGSRALPWGKYLLFIITIANMHNLTLR